MFLALLGLRRRHSQTDSDRHISRGLCSANINGNVYNLTDYFTKAYEYNEGDVTFIFHPCRALVRGDFPVGANVDIDGANVYMLTSTDSWQPVLYTTDFDWDELNSGIPGIMYTADGNPYQTDDMKYNRVDFEMRFLCDEQDKDVNPEFTHSVSYDRDSYGNIHTQITLMIAHYAGCATPFQPIPTPEPHFALCDYISRMDDDETRGIDAHLNILPNGAWGVRKRVTFMDNNMTLFYHPCGTMTCPLEFYCEEDENESSVYLCPETPGTTDHCQSFGVAQENQMHVSLYGENENFGLKIEYAGHGAKSEMHMLPAVANYPEGYLRILEDTTFSAIEGTLYLESTSHEADIVTVPAPHNPGDDYCYAEGSSGTAKIKVNLTNYNVEDGYQTSVTVKPLLSSTATLYFQPCGGLACPKNHSCDGIEDSTVLLCYDDQGCRSYGMIEYNVSLSYDSANLTKGFTAVYVSDHSKAQVQFECDESATSGSIILPETVTRNGDEVHFTVRTSDVCPDSPTPPAPVWYMPTPQPYSSPLPEPMKSPNPINFIANDTHYIVLNLDEIRDDQYGFNTTIRHQNDEPQDVYFTYRPWKQMECPSAYGTCQTGKNTGNSYLCYMTNTQERVCYSYADVEYDAHLDPLDPNYLGYGVDLTYNSQWDTDLSMQIICTPQKEFNVINLYEGIPLQYGKGLYGEAISISAGSKNACPVKFASNVFPQTPSPTPEPTPCPEHYFYHRTNVMGGLFMEIDLQKLAARKENVYLGMTNTQGSTYRPAMILFDPDSPKPCYQDECLGGGETNIWRCMDEDSKTYCWGVGDGRQGISWVDGEDFNEGITVTYYGGYADYTTTIQFMCNESIEEHTVDFDIIGHEKNHRITLYAHTSDVCPKKQGPTPFPTPAETPAPTATPEVQTIRSITGGSVFLLIIAVGASAYLFIGMLVTFKITGKFELPNAAFWSEFGTNVVTGAFFIFTCGRKQGPTTTGYDSI